MARKMPTLAVPVAANIPVNDIPAPEWSATKAAVDRARTHQVDVRAYATSAEALAIDAGPAILAAYADLMAMGGGVLTFGPADYRIGPTLIPMTPTAPLTIDLNGQTVRVIRPGASTSHGWRITAKTGSTLTASANVARGATSITLASASTVQPGDILSFSGSDVVETGWGTGRWASLFVERVVGNVVHFTTPFRIPFPATDCVITHYTQPKAVVVQNGRFHYDELPYNMAEPEVIAFFGMLRPRIKDVSVTSDQPYMSGGNNSGCGFRLASCVGANLSDVEFEGIHYGAVVTRSLNTYAQNIRATKTRHAIAPTGWSVNTVISGITGDTNWQTVESHPAFETHYSNVYVTREEAYPNLRCIGGSITNAVIHCEATNDASRPLMHNVELAGAGSLSWYDDAVLTLQNVQVVTPNMTSASSIGARYGNVILGDVVANVIRDNAERPAWEHTLKSITAKNCRNTDGTPWSRQVYSRPPRMSEPPVIHAYLAGDAYHIDPYRFAVDSSNDMLRCYGKIRQGVQAGGVFTIPLRVHTNAWNVPGDGYLTVVHGVIRLRATVRHGNVGAFDILTKEFHFFHNAASNGSVVFPTTPAYVDAPTGQDNESLAMTVTGTPTQSGRNAGNDTWVQIDVTLSSGRTNPIYGLTYDLELIKGV